MYKRILCILFCLTVLTGLSACGGKTSQNKATEAPTPTEAETSDTEGAANKEEILEMIGDDLKVVTEAELSGIIADMKAQPDQYYGKIYQLDGTCQSTEEATYIVGDSEEERLPLRYLTREYESGTKISVIGVPNSNDSGIIFDVLYIETVNP